MKRLTLAAAAATFAWSPAARAVELGAEGDVASVEVHAFVSQGFILSANNNYLSENTTDGSFKFSEVGINFTKDLTSDLRVGIQLFAQYLGPTGDYTPKIDWFYLDYHWRDWLGFRAGRVKIPYGLYNEINDVDQARVPVLLPQSVYPIQNTNYLLAQTGAELYGHAKLGGAGALEYRAYGGTILVDTVIPPNTPYEVVSFDVPYVIGGRLLWEPPVEGLRFAGSIQTFRLNADLTVATAPVTIGLPAELWVASAEYATGALSLAAEYSRWYAKVVSSDTALFPTVPLEVSERGYVMAAYRVSSWLQPGAYYAIEFPNVSDRTGRAGVQHDIATTLRFDVNHHWLIKLEGHFESGTAGLDPTINGGVQPASLNRDWAVFLAKTTAYF
ncbi:MAG TPA: hypothetical protein VGM56_06375 [Byssovorax sp.]